MVAPRTADTRGEEAILAAATAGHVMAGMPPSDEDLAAARRVLRGATTAEQEAARLLDEFHSRRG
ncbi:hypothetical protein CNO18_07360 [Gordonia sp. 1D]|nr:hypothetical protein CNO18_07360 [Gordonia sp. 1D]